MSKKLRVDSKWRRLTPKQRKEVDDWRFNQHMSYREMLRRVKKEFGLKATRQSLAAYLRGREADIESIDGRAKAEAARKQLALRPGAWMTADDLAAVTRHFILRSVYEMSMADPDDMQVKNLKALMKILNDERRLDLAKNIAMIKLGIPKPVTDMEEAGPAEDSDVEGEETGDEEEGAAQG